jgi:hypothetical protein
MTTAKAFLCAAVLLIAAACGPGPTDPSDFEFGRVDVYVRDAAAQPVNGAAVRLERLNGQTEDAGGLTGTAGPAGYYFFLKTSGSYRIVVTPPAGYAFADGQAGTVQVTFSRNQTQTVNFALRSI